MIGESNNERGVIAKYVTSALLESGLFQLNNFSNIADNVLDLVYTNSPEMAVVNLALSRLISFEC